MVGWLLTRLGRRIGVGTAPFWCPESHHQYEGGSNGVVFKGDLKSKNGFKGFGDLTHKMTRGIKQRSQVHKIGIMLPKVNKVMVARFQFKHLQLSH